MLLGSIGGAFLSSGLADSDSLVLPEVEAGGGGLSLPGGFSGCSDFGEVPTTGDFSGSVWAGSEIVQRKLSAATNEILIIGVESNRQGARVSKRYFGAAPAY